MVYWVAAVAGVLALFVSVMTLIWVIQWVVRS
jgi:hypothetical protein